MTDSAPAYVGPFGPIAAPFCRRKSTAPGMIFCSPAAKFSMTLPPAPEPGDADSTYVSVAVCVTESGFARTSSLWNAGVSTRTGRSRASAGIAAGSAATYEPSFVVLSLMTA